MAIKRKDDCAHCVSIQLITEGRGGTQPSLAGAPGFLEDVTQGEACREEVGVPPDGRKHQEGAWEPLPRG